MCAWWANSCLALWALRIAIVQDTCRSGVWLGWHICYNATQVSQGQLRENRNLSLSIRAKAVLIYVLSVPVHNDNCVHVRLRSHSAPQRVKARPSDPLVYVWILWCDCTSLRSLHTQHARSSNWAIVHTCIVSDCVVNHFSFFLRLEVSEKLPQG